MLPLRKAARRVRTLGADVLRRLPFDSRVLGPPKVRIPSALDHIRANPSLGEVLFVGEAVRSTRPSPKSAPEGDPLGLSATATHEHPISFVLRLYGARVSGPFATIITSDDAILSESLHVHPQYATRDALFDRWKLAGAQLMRGRFAHLGFLFEAGYHEWVLYNLPRLALLARAGVTSQQGYRYVLPSRPSSWQEQSLEALGIERSACVVLNGGHWLFEELVFPSFPSDQAVPWACEWLRERLTGGSAHRGTPGRRVYISRARANTRRVVNEAEVLARLERHRFTAYCTESMGFAEQVALFADAEAVIAPHGAGLTNCVFAAPGCKVLEFIEPTYVYPCFYWLTSACGHDYAYVVGLERPQAGHDGTHGWDMQLAIEDLESALARLTIGA